MKINKIVNLTLFNSFCLLMLASVLASCQKNNFPEQGLFTKWQTKSGRSIASIHSNLKPVSTLVSNQDLKQIVIYCKVNSSNPKACFKHEFADFISSFNQSKDKKNKHQIQKLKDQGQYDLIEKELNKITDEILHQVKPTMSKIVSNRKTFCEKNSKFFLNKCLSHYILKDTFAVLNQFYSKNKMNGQEYLYLKNVIKDKLRKSLSTVQESIEAQRSKTI